LVATALTTGKNLSCKSTCNCKKKRLTTPLATPKTKISVATLLATAKNITVASSLAI
jgi:hypothetical protein